MNDEDSIFGEMSDETSVDHDDDVDERERPDCEKCGTKTKWISYGFPARMPTEDDDWVLGGCDSGPGAEFECPKCGFQSRSASSSIFDTL
jgi:hypothetical protein